MGDWGFWDWLAYGGLGIAAVIQALNYSLKESAEMKERAAPVLESKWWNHLPLQLLIMSTVIFVFRASLTPISPPPQTDDSPLVVETTTTRSPMPRPPAELMKPIPPIPLLPGAGPRVGFGPEYLMSLVVGRTEEERDALLNLYKGRQVAATGTFGTASRFSVNPGLGLLILRLRGSEEYRSVGCSVGGDALQTAITLQPEAEVAVVGKFSGRAESDNVFLDDCEIISFAN